MRIGTGCAAAFLALGIALPALAGGDLKALPGYVDFDAQGILGAAEPKVEINLPTPMLRFMAGATGGEDPELAGMLSRLDHVRILVVELDPERAPSVRSSLEELIGRLKRDDWTPIIHVEEDGERVEIRYRMVGDAMAGLALVVTDGEELVFINVVGEFDPARMGALIGMMSGDEDLELGGLGGLGRGGSAGRASPDADDGDSE